MCWFRNLKGQQQHQQQILSNRRLLLNLILIILLNDYWHNQQQVNCFNFDVYAPVFKYIQSASGGGGADMRQPRQSSDIYFGYSIAQHFTKRDRVPYILVGAPQDSHRYINRSGAIYKCPFNLDRFTDCDQIQVDFKPSPNSDEANRKYSDEALLEQFKGRIYENQWFGVSLSSTGYGSFSACAHKYVHYYNFSKRDEYATYGACYTFSNEFEQEYKHVPCLLYTHQTNVFYFNNYAYCQAGTSVLMTEGPNLGDSDGTDTFMSFGMPSALNFRGLVGVRNKKKIEFLYGNGTDLCQFDIEYDLPKKRGYCPNLWDKFSYLGMSHAVINRYMNKERESLIAAGSPREEFYGLVRFFTITYDAQFGGPVTRRLNIVLRGLQKGAYFGFSMASCDVNGDKSYDLIVGAPYYSRKHEPNVGAIYVYLNNKLKGFSESFVFNYSSSIRSLFGHAIASIGDIDKDGFMDFAVGAPYETNPAELGDSSSSGAIFIFRGGSQPENIKLSQKIYAANVKLPLAANSIRLRGFGYSLSGGYDMDYNTYPDLAVGVMNSNAILVLRTWPIVRVRTYVTNIKNLQEIDQKKKECILSTKALSNDASCFRVEFCIELAELNYTTSQIDKFPPLNYSLDVEPNTVYSRVYFKLSNTNRYNSSIRLAKERSCTRLDVITKKDNFDFLTPIKFVLNYNFAVDRKRISRSSLAEIDKYPIIHEDTSEFKFEANFKKECGPDNNCLTDLKLQSEFVNLTIGDDNIPLLSFKESDSVSILIKLDNTGLNSEPAYATEITVTFDERLDFIRKDDVMINSFTCAINNKNKSNSLQCKMTSDIGGVPFPANYSTEFILTFSSTRLYRYANITSQPNIKFNIAVKTLSTDTDLTNNQVDILARLKVRANLFLYGAKTPEQLFYGDGTEVKGESAMKSLDEIGPIIEHTYKINNAGPFSVNFFQLIIDWPHETRLKDLNTLTQLHEGKHLLYLVEKPTKIPNNHPINIVCSNYEVDPLKLSENKYSRKRRSDEPEKSEQPSSQTAIIDCFSDTAFCQKITCNFYGDLNKDETISLKFTARVWNGTLVEDFADYEKVLIKSHGKINLNNDVHDDKLSDNEHSVVTLAYSNVSAKHEKELPIWVYLVSVLIGLLLLIISTIGFWMVGFFERKKYGDEKYLDESEKVKNTPY